MDKPIGKSRGICLPAVIADGLARHHAHEQSIYRRKIKKLKKMIRNIVLENAALCDTVASVQDELAFAIEERQYLLRKIMQIQLSSDHFMHQDIKSLPDYEDESTEKNLPKKTEDKKHLKISSQDGGSIDSRSSRFKKALSSRTKRRCPAVPLDATGRPIFPINLGKLTIHSIGEIIDDDSDYHTEQTIFPIGFCSSRLYASVKNPHQQTLYTCTIKEGENGPSFDIVSEGVMRSFCGKSPAECHAQILTRVNAVLGFDLLPTGVDSSECESLALRFFGLTHPSVQNMIQSCSGARKCANYKWLQFEVCKGEDAIEGALEPEREASICHETLLRNIRFASNHM